MSIILLPLALLVVAVHAGLMLRQRLMIRRHWLTTHARISLGTADEMRRAIEVFRKALGG